MKSMCKHWGLHISTNINCLSAVLGSFWAVWRGLLWCLKAKFRSWRFPRYWQFNKQYYSSYQLICLISRPLLIASRCWIVSIERSFQGLSVAIKTVRINKELVEIWPNEVCDSLRWNSAVSSGAETLEVDSQELCSWLYPFHLMRYWNLLWYQWLLSISSTSHSASPSMTMGSGWSSIFQPVIRSSRARVSFTTLNTRWSCFI